MKIPAQVSELIAKYHADGVSAEECLACSSGCCSHGGFAILENVLEIYALYQKGKLKRKGYRFPKGLLFRDFVFMHFDVWSHSTGPDDDKQEIVFFHMCSIDEQGRPIHVPGGGSYWDIRGGLFDNNPWLNRGCIFLSHSCPNWPEDDRYTKRHCILHSADCCEVVGAKPIDCVFFTCSKPYAPKIPSREESEQWFRALSEAFPNSKSRFESLIGETGTTGAKPSSETNF